MKPHNFIGTGVAIVSPFKNNKLDFSSLNRIIDHLIENGVKYIVSLGSTGEASMVSMDEAKEILDFTIEKVDNRVPIVAGNFTGNNTKEICDRLDHYDLKGIDALLISSPAYVKPTQEGIYQHYIEIARHTDLPIIIYNVPGRTSSNIQWQTTVRLAEFSDKFIGIKEASADLIQCEQIIKNTPDQFLVISGDDPTALALCGIGGNGVISVIGNAYPGEFSQMIDEALNGRMTRAQSINQGLCDIHKWLYIEGNPTGIKAALEILGFCSREVRLPLVSMSDNNFINLKTEMEKFV